MLPPAPINRELSLLAFQRRVLALAQDAALPLLERLRYLCIVGSNLDEFFEIRVAGIKELLRSRRAPPGTSLSELQRNLQAIGDEARRLIAEQYTILNDDLLPALAHEGVVLLRRGEFSESVRRWIAAYFDREVRPLLTPVALDQAHPFPNVVNKSLHFAVELSGVDAFGRDRSIAIVKAPRVLPRIIRLPEAIAGARNVFVMLSSVIHTHLADLFPQREILAYSQFRVTRDADLWLDEEDVKDLREALQGELSQRQFGIPLRLEVAAECPDHLAQFLLRQFDLGEADLYRCNGPVNLARLSSLADEVADARLKFPPFTPGRPRRLTSGDDILATIRRRDILLHHPYQSFDPVIEFIRRAADDPDVVAVKQTVYRTGASSTLMEALLQAARRGKEVLAVVELMARFDEETNINWAEKLEDAGAQVVYGVFGLKTHAKLALLLRRETGGDGLARLVSYAHLGTGNYHPRTAALYSDFGLLTADPKVCHDVNEVFFHVTSLSPLPRMQRLLVAPLAMHDGILAMIGRETEHAREGKPARIRAKMNGLTDESVIAALCEASQAGVKVDLVVRSACALRPGVPGLTDNIRVRSVLGRFLEHHRVWCFDNAGRPDVWLASADWMGRNLFRRIEVAFPIRSAPLRRRVVDEGLDVYFADTRDAWDLQPSGEWVRAQPTADEAGISVQGQLMQRRGNH